MVLWLKHSYGFELGIAFFSLRTPSHLGKVMVVRGCKTTWSFFTEDASPPPPHGGPWFLGHCKWCQDGEWKQIRVQELLLPDLLHDQWAWKCSTQEHSQIQSCQTWSCIWLAEVEGKEHIAGLIDPSYLHKKKTCDLPMLSHRGVASRLWWQ